MCNTTFVTRDRYLCFNLNCGRYHELSDSINAAINDKKSLCSVVIDEGQFVSQSNGFPPV